MSAAERLNERVDILCYNRWENMTRREGLEKYRQGMLCSDGSEHERYEKIFFDLLEGKMIATDSWSQGVSCTAHHIVLFRDTKGTPNNTKWKKVPPKSYKIINQLNTTRL